MVELKVRNTKDGAPLTSVEPPDGGYRLVSHEPAFEHRLAKAEDIIGRYVNTLRILAS